MVRRSRRSPLPVRNGLNPTRLQMPHDAGWATVGDFLFNRFSDDVPRLRERFAVGEVVDELGRSYAPSSTFKPGGLLFLYRDPPVEKQVPFAVEVLHRDDDLLVVDKPHFLAVTPRGSYVQETVLVRLRQQLDLPELSPAHRLDRPTAGVLVLTVRREARRLYQELFAQRSVRKVYEAVAPVQPQERFPLTVRSRIEKQHGVLQARETAGAVNAETLVEFIKPLPASSVGDGAPLGLFRLTPTTGRTHQLRVHMASLGMPLVYDSLYPQPLDVALDDYSKPLQLLARTLGFTDPRTGNYREFTSQRSLALADQRGPRCDR